jgi:hypothetical protein
LVSSVIKYVCQIQSPISALDVMVSELNEGAIV